MMHELLFYKHMMHDLPIRLFLARRTPFNQSKWKIARLGMLALLYFFAIVRSLFTDTANSPRLPRSQLLDTDEISRYPMLITTFIIFTIVISVGKCLEYLPLHFCG